MSSWFGHSLPRERLRVGNHLDRLHECEFLPGSIALISPRIRETSKGCEVCGTVFWGRERRITSFYVIVAARL
jgi:hypothetical protein